MYAFDYQRASDAQGAVKALAADADAKFLGGGQSLLAAMKLRLAQPSTLVDVTRIPELKAVQVDGQVVKVGAAVCHADVAENAQIRNTLPALADLAGMIGDRQVRALGTLGGSLANDDPAADYPAAVLALNATVVTDRRRIAADDFFLGMYETALEPDELIVSVEFQVPERAAYEKFPNPASHFALAGVFVAKYGGEARVAVTGAGPSVFRAGALESALKTNFAPEAARAVKLPADDLNTDLHASAAYRAHLIPVLAARAVAKANG
ncbi:FAD binding domain-containing protein [Paraburkholderia silvatlantica]|uniref:Carbon-monoxide dehydrogenase medium subunit n=1 Tax=Paraburkholderia silvatlantica TaxID=321895 RepID=A0ABR6FKU1_9BURK|nr:xanthine dehydrogenase family protein subunit M [Paraburkholderia silvatlantica]MBB2927194.1 carbon-monoxide dehydrogenase medium subunit [Paraburkholderia silvatlantica]PVY36915.1 carbon-monoxide dehydrogenase medium subunit [Paraburkholderia silvatlantica]PXW41807.1 carbon-monoxide dehydrogenase medium subunit [Paraburkholderia silvatlantica]